MTQDKSKLISCQSSYTAITLEAQTVVKPIKSRKLWRDLKPLSVRGCADRRRADPRVSYVLPPHLEAL